MKKTKSTFDQIMSDPVRKQQFDEGYAEFVLQEELLRCMEEQKLTVRALASKADVSKTTVQMLRTGDIAKITLSKLKQILHAMDLEYEIILKSTHSA